MLLFSNQYRGISTKIGLLTQKPNFNRMNQSTKNSRIIFATAAKIYDAMTTANGLEAWQAPGEMTGKVHHIDAREGGGYEMSLYYPAGEQRAMGKTADNVDRFKVNFVQLIPSRKIVETVNFTGDDPAFAGTMTIEISLEPAAGGTEVTFLFTDIPRGIKPEDNETGTISSLDKLARYVEEEVS